ncbi:proteoglycan 4-like [Sesbania bispinosa]|nr:proteoglycan 4-like [Sesbania bispinosa]
MIIERIRLILHHRGSLLREEGVLKYVGGEMCVWEGIDIDTVNIITVEALCKEHYYPRFDKIYWLKPGRKLEVGFRVLEKDAHVVNMCNAARKNEGEIEIFFTHPIEQTPTLSKSSTPHVASPLHTSEMSDGSDDYESAEDSAYRPSPCLSDEDDSVVKKKSDKGKGIAVDSSKKMKSPAGRKRKGRDCATGSGNAGTANREHEQETEEPAHMDEDNIFEYEEPEHRDQYDSFEHEVNGRGGVPPKPKNWAPPTTENEQSQQDEVDLSQGDDTSAGNEGNNFTASTYTPEVAEVQLNATPNVVGRNTTTAPTPIQMFAAPNITGGSTGVRPPSKGMPSKNPPYRPPGLVTKVVFRHKMKTLRPPSSRSVVSPQSTPTEPLAPSQGVIQPSSQTSGEQPMAFIPTPRGPPPQPK